MGVSAAAKTAQELMTEKGIRWLAQPNVTEDLFGQETYYEGFLEEQVTQFNDEQLNAALDDGLVESVCTVEEVPWVE
jgi:hypothetical protein